MTLEELAKELENQEEVFVFSKNPCVYCEATKRDMKALGIKYREIFIDQPENAEILEHLKASGFMKAPIVIAGTESWQGYEKEKISSLKGKF